jgi:hypothetical protein
MSPKTSIFAGVSPRRIKPVLRVKRVHFFSSSLTRQSSLLAITFLLASYLFVPYHHRRMDQANAIVLYSDGDLEEKAVAPLVDQGQSKAAAALVTPHQTVQETFQSRHH